MSDPQLQRRMEQRMGVPDRDRLKYLLAKKAILHEVKERAEKMTLNRPMASDYYDAWRELYQENELAIGIEERRDAGGRNEV